MANTPTNMPYTPMNKEAVYQQDAEFCRYQDRLRWSRFQATALIEGALVYAVWGPTAIGPVSLVLVAVAGAFLVLLLTILARIDEDDYRGHLFRIQMLEGELDSKYHFTRQKGFCVQKGWTGQRLMLVCSIVLNLFNIWLVLVSIGKATCGKMI